MANLAPPGGSPRAAINLGHLKVPRLVSTDAEAGVTAVDLDMVRLFDLNL